MHSLPYIQTAIPHSSPLTRIQSTPSPSSSNSVSSLPSDFDPPGLDRLSVRRNSEPPTEGDGRHSFGSMTSWSSDDGSLFEPPDIKRSDFNNAPMKVPDLPFTPPSPHDTTTSSFDQDVHYFSQHHGNASPASSVTSTAHSKGGQTPRAEYPPNISAFGPTSPISALRKINSDTADVDMEAQTSGAQQQSLKPETFARRKHSSLDASSPDCPAPFGHLGPSIFSLTEPVRPSAVATGGQYEPDRRASESGSSGSSDQRVIAQSSATGCRISAPISPPAHYPGSAKSSGRRSSPTRSFGEVSGGTSPTASSSGSSDSFGSSMLTNARATPPAPRWAHPPRVTNKISGRAWSFSQGQARPDIDFDPELFDTSEPDAVQEILKGMEGRIAVKTTPGEYNIMAWLPGFSIDDITISMKGDRTVQIVADLWDEGDHAQWNVLLGEDVNKSAIAATFKGAELRVTVKRKPSPSHQSFRSASSAWSASGKIINSPGVAGADSERSALARYPSVQQLSH